jgi:hypothetical protein
MWPSYPVKLVQSRLLYSLHRTAYGPIGLGIATPPVRFGFMGSQRRSGNGLRWGLAKDFVA